MNLHNWNSVKQYINSSAVRFSGTFVENASTGKFPADAFSLGQLCSKIWLLETLREQQVEVNKVAVLGAWICTIAEPLCDLFPSISRIYGIDCDSTSVELSDLFNNLLVQQDWRYKGVVADVDLLFMNNLIMDISGTLVEDKPDTVINTSCEHMSTEWFDTVDADQLVIIQSNNNAEFTGHINTCKDLDDFCSKYQLSKLLYAGEMNLPVYTRYMAIGYK